jgi:pilus assembly protein FimV
MTDRQRPWNGEPPVSNHGPTVPDAFVAEQNRIRSTRATAALGLTQRRWRRRVLPPLAVTSAVLLGAGTAGAWVNAELTAKSAPPAAADASSQIATLEQLRQQLSADQQTLAAMTVAVLSAQPQAGSALTTPATAATTTAPAPGQAAATPQLGKPKSGTTAPKTNAAPRVAGPAAVVPKAASPATKPVTAAAAPVVAPAPAPAAAPAPAPKQAPAPAPPPTHATTGASGAKP